MTPPSGENVERLLPQSNKGGKDSSIKKDLKDSSLAVPSRSEGLERLLLFCTQVALFTRLWSLQKSV
jgi:hypothetical protein